MLLNHKSSNSLPFFFLSRGNKGTMCLACNKIGRFYRDNDYFAGIPSFSISRLKGGGNIEGGFLQK
jgi:hypothetical protein